MTLEFHQELDWQLKQNDADRIRLESENKSLLQEIQQCKQALVMNRKSFALKERDLRDQCAHLENEIQILGGVVVGRHCEGRAAGVGPRRAVGENPSARDGSTFLDGPVGCYH